MTSHVSPLYVRLLARLVLPFPNFDFRFIKPVRQRAAALLCLKPGDRVIDGGCGSGGSFPYLVREVGASGKVLGVEISPASATHARLRANANGWTNVEVVESSAQDVQLSGLYDGLLMFAAPDLYACPASLARLTTHLRKDVRVVFFGAKASTRRFGWLLNPLLKLAMARFSLPTTPRLEVEPWLLAEEYLNDLEVQEYFYGWMFIAAGTFRGQSRIGLREQNHFER